MTGSASEKKPDCAGIFGAGRKSRLFRGGEMRQIILPARLENLGELIGFVSACAEDYGLSPEKIGTIELAAEEALVNIIRYAYPEKPGEIEIYCHQNETVFMITFKDWGIPFNPLSRPDPNTHLSLAERQIGGMGILLIKKMIPEVRYRREDQANILSFVIPEEK